eukprot:2842926-Amphidinium_carterae.1
MVMLAVLEAHTRIVRQCHRELLMWMSLFMTSCTLLAHTENLKNKVLCTAWANEKDIPISLSSECLNKVGQCSASVGPPCQSCGVAEMHLLSHVPGTVLRIAVNGGAGGRSCRLTQGAEQGR